MGMKSSVPSAEHAKFLMRVEPVTSETKSRNIPSHLTVALRRLVKPLRALRLTLLDGLRASAE